ncbi:MAG: GNAT family N-acetyltransferase [Ginsengibacter sp.]
MLTVKKYDESLLDVWDDFILSNHRNATFLHSRKFFLHNPLNLTGDASLLFYKKNRLICVLPAKFYKKENRNIFHSHPASTYGGFVVDGSVGVAESMAIVEATIHFAKSESANEIIIRNPFRIFHQLPSDETDYAMWFYGFKIHSRELECAILIDENSAKRYEDGTRRSIKKASKLVEVGHSEKFEEFWEILTSNLYLKYKLKPVHTLEQILTLRELVGSENIQLVVAEVGNKVVAGIVLFVFKTALHAQYIASDNSFQDMRPLNAVIDFIVQWGKKSGHKYFNFGTANENEGRMINEGLFKFKEGFGGRGVLRESMILYLDQEH